jgi:predicted transcriptional regulator
MTQETLSTLTGLRQFHISRIENGTIKAVTTDTLKVLVEALHVSSDYLIGVVDEPTKRR